MNTQNSRIRFEKIISSAIESYLFTAKTFKCFKGDERDKIREAEQNQLPQMLLILILKHAI